MNTKHLILVPLLLILISCSSESSPKSKEIAKIEYIKNEIPPVDNFNYDTLKGMYTGNFGGNEMRIILNYVSSTNVIGYNIHKGLQRNINGKLRKNGDSIVMSLPEPGDHEFDGVFELIFIGIDKNPKATWVSNSGKISAKKLKLTKIEAPKDSKEGVNISNFTNFFSFVYDSLGNYTFESDGFCLYEYYPKTDDENRVEQLKEVKGMWSLKGNTVIIDWQKNTVFPESKMTFQIIKSEYEDYMLKGKDRNLYYFYY